MALTKVIGAGLGSVSSADLDGAVTINESSADKDFRVESNGQANMLFVDGGNDAVIIQDTTSRDINSAGSKLQINHTDYNCLSMAVYKNAQDGAVLSLGHSRSGTIGTNTVLQDGDALGNITFVGADGTDLNTQGARIDVNIDGTPGSNDLPTRMSFRTTADGASSTTERVRIHSNGVASFNNGIALGVGTANTSSNVLDDYEEGTWTPSINNGSSNLGTTGIIATYTKIGRTVYAEFQLQRSDTSSDTNYFYLAGLPFTSINGPRLAGQAWIDNSSNDIKCFMYLGSNSTTASFPKAGGNDSAVSLNEFSNARYVYGALVYNT